MWTQAEGLEFARTLEPLAVQCGAHVGLTGGLLYKDGPRKDLDIVVYEVRQERFDKKRFLTLLRILANLEITGIYGFVVKARDTRGRVVDFLFPDYEGEATYYPAEETA